MKRKTLTIGILTAIATFAVGIANAHGPKDPAEKLDRMTEKLGLYDDQVPQVQAILEETRAKIDEIRSTYTLDQRDEAHEAMKLVRSETHERLAEVLTAEQMDLLEAHHDKMRARHEGRGHKRWKDFD